MDDSGDDTEDRDESEQTSEAHDILSVLLGLLWYASTPALVAASVATDGPRQSGRAVTPSDR